MTDPTHATKDLTARLAKALGLSQEAVTRIMQGQDALTRLQTTVGCLEASERTLQASEAHTLASILGTHPMTFLGTDPQHPSPHTSKETPNE